jgi:hypothetical protein
MTGEKCPKLLHLPGRALGASEPGARQLLRAIVAPHKDYRAFCRFLRRRDRNLAERVQKDAIFLQVHNKHREAGALNAADTPGTP